MNDIEYAPYCKHYKETYLECAICMLDGQPCRLETSWLKVCDKYKKM